MTRKIKVTAASKIMLSVIGILIVTCLASLISIFSNLNSEDRDIDYLSANQTETIIVTPTPKPYPSEKALRIASFAMVRLNEQQKSELKNQYKLGNSSDLEFIKAWAIHMDMQPELLIRNEAIMEKIMAEEGRPVYNTYDSNESPPVINVETPEMKIPQSCTSNQIGSYTYTNCF